MSIQYFYSRVPLSEIRTGLDRLFSGLELGPGIHITRSSNSNLLVLVSGTDRFREIDDFIDSLALIHPCRFFVIAVDEGLEEIYAEISARCHGLSPREQVCSEIVRLSLPSGRLPALPELVRASLVPGTTSEVLLWDGSVPPPLIEHGARVADRVFLDSGQNTGFLSLADRLLATAIKPVDLQWISLAPWREHLKDLAGASGVARLLPQLTEVRITAEASLPYEKPSPSCMMLMAGWIVARLQLDVIGWEDSYFTTINDRGQRVRLTLETALGGSEPRLSRLVLSFSGRDESTQAGSIITQLSGQHLETLNEKGQSVIVRRVMEAETFFSRIKFFFEFGYSASHYLEALRVALELASLQQESSISRGDIQASAKAF